MSLPSSDYVLNNGERYNVSIQHYHKENSIVIYEAAIFDTAFAQPYRLFFRFSALKKIHQAMVNTSNKKAALPAFPVTRSSFGFWNRTNKDPSRISERIREL